MLLKNTWIFIFIYIQLYIIINNINIIYTCTPLETKNMQPHPCNTGWPLLQESLKHRIDQIAWDWSWDSICLTVSWVGHFRTSLSLKQMLRIESYDMMHVGSFLTFNLGFGRWWEIIIDRHRTDEGIEHAKVMLPGLCVPLSSWEDWLWSHEIERVATTRWGQSRSKHPTPENPGHATTHIL